MSKLGIALTALNGLFFAGSLGLSPIAPPAFAQFLATSFNISQRNDVSFASVAVARPNEPGKNMAFDIVPGEGAISNSDSGYAWQDICNIDPIRHPGSPIFCARSGIKDGWAEFGSKNYDGAGVRNVRIIMGNTVGAELSIDPSNNDPVLTIKGRIKARGYDIVR
ncbi:hypothetical protein [Rhizobium indigoferae]|uniref:Uncharacterized protein n=1 Tax=Rhizobium indigoferae TaxID=158891 RepID=A0ABZ0Z885_9HYPH|nr:hypothetical protein [Rhizobium indigoferae]WQN35797.1 hypothetical protein U5G49_000848 [Rhizobium indigoferae]GLR58273.1 hypothetical protein GCM10007919_29990 [Rhizobium indigoferae]